MKSKFQNCIQKTPSGKYRWSICGQWNQLLASGTTIGIVDARKQIKKRRAELLKEWSDPNH